MITIPGEALPNDTKKPKLSSSKARPMIDVIPARPHPGSASPVTSPAIGSQDPLAKRLAALELQLSQSQHNSQSPVTAAKPVGKRKRPSFKTVLWISALLFIMMAGALYGYKQYQLAAQHPLPANIVRLAGFRLYYPRTLPPGYAYVKDSASMEAGTVFFKLKNGSKEISIIEQPDPKRDLLLDSAVGFSAINTPLGTAHIGKNNAMPLAIIKTQDTLINISGSPDVSTDVISSVLNSLVAVPTN